MIDQLVRYATQKGLHSEPGFATQTIRWCLSFSADGRYLGVVPLGDKVGRKFDVCPNLSQPELVRLNPGSQFLYESADCVVLYKVKPEDLQKKQEKHNFFIGLLEQASAAVPELKAVAQSLRDPQICNRICEDLERNKVKPTDKLTLQVGSNLLLEDSRWHDWWRRFRSSIGGNVGASQATGGARMVCFATGDSVVPEPTHPKIRGLADVGGQSSGSSLVGFDKDAFESYGLKQSANAAVSAESAAAYRAALEDLLQNNANRLAGTKVAYWYSHAVPSENDPLAYLLVEQMEEGQEAQARSALQRARNLLNYLHTGRTEAIELGHSYFYILTLSGAAGRVMVRDWAMGQFEDLATHVAEWFEHLRIVRYDGGGDALNPGLERLVTSLLPLRSSQQQYEDWIKPLSGVRTSLLHAAIEGTPLPFEVLGRILYHHNQFVLSGDWEEAVETRNRNLLNLLQARMALLKAYHVRNKGDKQMQSNLNKQHPSPAYHCGRLMAVYARLQEAALGNVGAGVVQRFYAAACATPALVLARLDRTARFHLNSIESKGLQNWYLDQLTEIYNAIPERLPRTLSLEDQSLFALGYYHQLAEMRSPTKSASPAGQPDHETIEEEKNV